MPVHRGWKALGGWVVATLAVIGLHYLHTYHHAFNSVVWDNRDYLEEFPRLVEIQRVFFLKYLAVIPIMTGGQTLCVLAAWLGEKGTTDKAQTILSMILAMMVVTVPALTVIAIYGLFLFSPAVLICAGHFLFESRRLKQWAPVHIVALCGPAIMWAATTVWSICYFAESFDFRSE
jgi:hypothetical protein